MHKVWSEKYKATTPSANEIAAAAQESRAHDKHVSPSEHGMHYLKSTDFNVQRFSAARRYFDILQDKSTSVDALEDWLSSPIINTSQDPIAYWAGMQAAGHPLATMALDFLSIPGEFLSSIMLHISKLNMLYTSNLH